MGVAEVKDGARSRYAYQLPSSAGAVRPRSTIKNLRAALDVLSDLDLNDRAPTQEELDILAGYSGTGSSAVAQAFKWSAAPSAKHFIEALRAIGGEESVAAISRAMNPRSAWVKWCNAWGVALRSAFTGTPRSEKGLSIEIKSSRLRRMAYSPMFSGQKGGAFSPAEEKRTRGKELQDGALGDERR